MAEFDTQLIAPPELVPARKRRRVILHHAALILLPDPWSPHRSYNNLMSASSPTRIGKGVREGALLGALKVQRKGWGGMMFHPFSHQQLLLFTCIPLMLLSGRQEGI